MVIRDPAHAIRISTQKPLHLEQEFGAVYSELIGNRHSLISDIQNSGKWRLQLEAMERECLRIPALSREGAMKCVLRHLSMAKQRMDSAADPLAKLCLMLMPVCLLLSYKASDTRCSTEERQRAESMLAKMQPKFLLEAGVSADWGIITVAFLRVFDAKGHDIVNSAAELEHFCETIDAVFVEGGLFCPTPVAQPVAARGQPVAADASPGGFITDRVRRQMRYKCVFNCGTRPLVVWGACKPEDVQNIHQRVRVAAQVMKERLRGEFAGMRMAWSILRLARIEDIFATRRQEEQAKYRSDAKTMAAAFGLDEARLRHELADASPVALRHYAACGADRHSVHFKNKTVWELFLDPAFIATNFAARPAPFSELPVLLRIWFGLLDGEAQVERDLGDLRNLLTLHAGPIGDDMLDSVLMLRLNGPKDPQEIAVPTCGGGLVPTERTKEFAALWRGLYGARVGCAPGDRKGVPGCRRGLGFKEVRGRVLAAAARVRQSRGASPSEVPTAYGLPSSAFQAAPQVPPDRSPYWTKKFDEFSKLSKRKEVEHSLFPFAKRAKLTMRHAAPIAQPVTGGSTATFLPSSCITCADRVRLVVGVHCCRTAHVIVLETIDSLHQVLPACGGSWVIHLLYIVGLGKHVTTVHSWTRIRGDLSSPDAGRMVIQHKAGAENKKKPVEFLLTRAFKDEFPEVLAALRACAGIEGSAWSLVNHFTARPPKKMAQVQVNCLSALWEWLQMNRFVVNVRGKAKVWCDGGTRCC